MIYDTNHLISQLKESGLTQREFCEKNKIPVSTLAYHLRKKKESEQEENQSFIKKDFIPVSLSNNSESSESYSIVIVKGAFSPESLSAFIRTSLQ